jgi:hypothetical protein
MPITKAALVGAVALIGTLALIGTTLDEESHPLALPCQVQPSFPFPQ